MDKLSKMWIKCIQIGHLGSDSSTCFSLRTENPGLNFRIFHPRENRPKRLISKLVPRNTQFSHIFGPKTLKQAQKLFIIKWLMPKFCPKNKWWGKNFEISIKSDLPPTFLLNCILFFAFDACRSLSTIFVWFRISGFFFVFLDFFPVFVSVFSDFSVFIQFLSNL